MAMVDMRPCGCGSGLRQVRCCSLDGSALASPEASRQLAPLIERAIQSRHKGADAAAERLCIDVLELSPGDPDMLWMLSRLRDAGRAADAAEALVRRLVALYPNHVHATQDLALRLVQRGALVEAEVHARNAVRIAPDDFQSHNLVGLVLTELHQPVTGEFHYRRTLELAGRRDPILLANLAWSLKLQGRMEEARALYAESVAAAPDVFQTLLGWAKLEEADRDFARARDLVVRAERVAPGHPSLQLLRAVIDGRTGEHVAALATLDGLAERGAFGPEELLEKGRLLDRLGRTDDAFAAFSEGKRRLRELTGGGYLAAEAAGRAARQQNFFTANRLATLPRAGVRADVPQPVFVLGFPRSGTTLMEQSLTAHPLIAAGDELPFVAEVAEIMPRVLLSPLDYPEALSELWMGDRCEGLDNLRDHYLQRARQRGILRAGATLFTDKMPLNEFDLGLIALLFPAAPLVHVLRHPLDSVLSCFSNLLTHGYRCAYALETAAEHYALTADLVAHYRAEMALRYLPVRYEDVVTDQERTLRRVLDFVGVPFDPACLAPHENRRYARTASYAQVTEKLYDRSRERWRRYRAHLEPVIPILRPTIERLGYSVD
jgi:Flp pilus assembly protein TadD